jgi:hypothetical protein
MKLCEKRRVQEIFQDDIAIHPAHGLYSCRVFLHLWKYAAKVKDMLKSAWASSRRRGGLAKPGFVIPAKAGIQHLCVPASIPSQVSVDTVIEVKWRYAERG